MSYARPYLDSSVFIAFFKGTEIALGTTVDRAPIAKHVIKNADAGKYPIVTSTLTIAEVHRRRGWTKLDEKQSADILDYFEMDFITLVEVDRAISEEAHRICRDYNARPNDGIHIASAIRAGCDVLLVWDARFEAIRHPGIKIEQPRMLGQTRLDLKTEGKANLRVVKSDRT